MTTKHQIASREIRAHYDEQTIRVYQAYNDAIADEALQLQHFGSKFSMNRMTWIKPSFLWMMYRSGWATKENQTRILALDLKRSGFDEMVQIAVPSTFNPKLKYTLEKWKSLIKESEVRVQWDPERDPHGNPSPTERSLQLGIRGQMLQRFNHDFIVAINDITDYVVSQRELLSKESIATLSLPSEFLYQLPSGPVDHMQPYHPSEKHLL